MRLSVEGYGAYFCNTGQYFSGRWAMRVMILVAMLLLVGCGPKPVGADRDRHGCLGSGGYEWCPGTQECVRSWELAEAHGYEDAEEAFDAVCLGEAGEA